MDSYKNKSNEPAGILNRVVVQNKQTLAVERQNKLNKLKEDILSYPELASKYFDILLFKRDEETSRRLKKELLDSYNLIKFRESLFCEDSICQVRSVKQSAISPAMERADNTRVVLPYKNIPSPVQQGYSVERVQEQIRQGKVISNSSYDGENMSGTRNGIWRNFNAWFSQRGGMTVFGHGDFETNMKAEHMDKPVDAGNLNGMHDVYSFLAEQIKFFRKGTDGHDKRSSQYQFKMNKKPVLNYPDRWLTVYNSNGTQFMTTQEKITDDEQFFEKKRREGVVTYYKGKTFVNISREEYYKLKNKCCDEK